MHLLNILGITKKPNSILYPANAANRIIKNFDLPISVYV